MPMPSDEDEHEWQERLEERMFPMIAGWFQRITRPPVTPSAGSSLARDDEAYPGLPASHLAYGGMVTAAEHLEFFRVSFLATGRAVPPAAYFTVLRTALMGVAQSLWILKPADRPTRIEHALRIARDDINQRKGLLSVALPSRLGLGGEVETQRARLDEELGELQAAAAAAGLDAGNVPRWRLTMTNVIADVGDLVHADDGNDDTRYGVSVLWRMQSGHAHSTASARARQIDPQQLARNPDGTLTGAATASVTDVGTAAAAVVLWLNEAWRLYDLRCAPA
ncbi:hypothetical protein [Amycolatopsis rubida]|uniref:Uncharacterized protein n=1 Tax=Amycolatopsis rubida TaxID=112413 RepID=A0A1I5X689_9PSEU|nr:hypothetical protein [Amycolatopsis rubida]SFQ27492.1 hypothetical protein SAMN05421854_11056 [Amycolatopsis rubida]